MACGMSKRQARAYLAGTTKSTGHAKERTANRPGSQHDRAQAECSIASVVLPRIWPLRTGTVRGPVVPARYARQGPMRNPSLDGAPTPRYDSAGDGHYPSGRKDDPRRSVAGGTGLGRRVHFRASFVFAQTAPERQLPASEQNVGALDFVFPPMTLALPYCYEVSSAPGFPFQIPDPSAGRAAYLASLLSKCATF
jgi:hypothetical protein